MVFLLLGYISGYKSIRKKHFDIFLQNESLMKIIKGNNQGKLDIWSSKKTDDFLRYLKWEAFTLGYYIT